jgi:hypothetical protein
LGLNEALLELERQAAVVASYLDPDDEELLQAVADAWAPFPTTQCSITQRKRWALNWIEWLFEAASRWEARPAEPSADDLHKIIVRWVCASGRARR